MSVLRAVVLAASVLGTLHQAAAVESKKEADVALPNGLPPGPLHIIVSIEKQRAKLYSNGQPIVSMPVSTGVPDHPTPTGVFTILQKRTWHESNIYSAAPMPFMQRITWSGVAMHEGVLPGYPASHGCIRLPHDAATWLFGITDLGVRVIVTNDDPGMEEISHPFLFESKLTPAAAAGPRRLASLDADAGDPQDAARINTISVFISKKEGRLFVRRNFAALFDTPVKIDDRSRPLGTHVFTAMDFKNGGPEMRWSVISMKSKDGGNELHDRYSTKERWVGGHMIRTAWFSRERWTPQNAGEVLDRLDVPHEAVDRISELLTPGSSLIVSDEGLNKETRKHTDFVVLTAPSPQFLKSESQQEKRRGPQEPVMRLQPPVPTPVPVPQRAKVDAAPRTADRPAPTPHPAAAQHVAPPPPLPHHSAAAKPAASSPAPKAAPDTTRRADEEKSRPAPTTAEPAPSPPPQRVRNGDTPARANKRRTIVRSTNVETEPPQRARLEAERPAPQAPQRVRLNVEPVAPRVLYRSRPEPPPRSEERRPAGSHQIDLTPP